MIKTYTTREAERYFNAERFAFQRFHRGSIWARNILGYYSAFQHGGHFNIVLEYANHGTLEDLLQNMSPPAKDVDIQAFWSGLLELANGLICIHGAEPEQHGLRLMLGCAIHGFFFFFWFFLETSANIPSCHQELKPSNILVLHADGDSKYQFTFKIGDLGTSHFRQCIGNDYDVKDTVASGTSTYGPFQDPIV